MSEIKISVAGPQDAEELLEIYAPYVRDTAVSFEYTVPSPEEFRQRIIHTLEKYPYLKAEKDGEVIGYAYAGPLHPRAAYAWSVETSIYVKRDKKHLGIGKLLYDTLEKILKEQNILSVNACIAWPEKEDEYLTGDSVRFHEHMGQILFCSSNYIFSSSSFFYDALYGRIGDLSESCRTVKVRKIYCGMFFYYIRIFSVPLFTVPA